MKSVSIWSETSRTKISMGINKKNQTKRHPTLAETQKGFQLEYLTYEERHEKFQKITFIYLNCHTPGTVLLSGDFKVSNS
ncbi:hypothetical protein HZS_6253 [Henneguya salminicola]|nr:hypothetical protein HZS_6253 [Henneguya salminicola]